MTNVTHISQAKTFRRINRLIDTICEHKGAKRLVIEITDRVDKIKGILILDKLSLEIFISAVMTAFKIENSPSIIRDFSETDDLKLSMEEFDLHFLDEDYKNLFLYSFQCAMRYAVDEVEFDIIGVSK